MSTHLENIPAASERLGDVVRLVRRICLLREAGEPMRAVQAEEDELAPAVELCRKMQGADALSDQTLAEIFAIETRRVAEAEVLCELLVPRLAARLPSTVTGGTTMTTPVSRASSPAASAPTGPPAIPDLLDAMLALDRAGARRSSATRSKF